MHDGLPIRHMRSERYTESDFVGVVFGGGRIVGVVVVVGDAVVVVGGVVVVVDVVVGPRLRCGGRGGAIASHIVTYVGHDVPPTADMFCERCHEIGVVQFLPKEYCRLTAPSVYGDL